MSFFNRRSHWLLVLACWALYVPAFALPAVARDRYPRLVYDPALVFPDPAGGRPPSFEKVVVQDLSGLSGRDAFALTWTFRDEVWLANPALGLGTICLAWRLWSCAAAAGLVGLSLAVLTVRNVGSHDTEYVYGTGYWLWAASLGVLFAGWLARRDRQSPAELLRGWRGVALVGWVGVAAVVLAAWWERHPDVYPPAPWRAG